MAKLPLLFFIFGMTCFTNLVAQDAVDKDKPTNELLLYAQIWGMYQTMDIDRGADADSRMDFFIRRGRFGYKGEINSFIGFKVWFAFDNLGKETLNNPVANLICTNTEDAVFRPWDAFFKIKIIPEHVITVGYFRPQTSRESIRSAFETLSYEKTLTNFVYRSYSVGKSPGRTNGVDFSGKFINDSFGFSYNAGIFNAFEDKPKSSNLFAGRLAFWIGNEEKGEYKDNHFFKRNGITIAGYGNYQGKVDQTALSAVTLVDTTVNTNGKTVQSVSYGTDVLANYESFSFKSEYMVSKYAGFKGGDGVTGDYIIRTVDALAGYMFPQVGIGDLEFAFGYENVSPDEKLVLKDVSVIDSKYAVKYGNVTALDFGINYYLNKNKLKFALHYVMFDEEIKKYDNDYAAIAMQVIW